MLKMPTSAVNEEYIYIMVDVSVNEEYIYIIGDVYVTSAVILLIDMYGVLLDRGYKKSELCLLVLNF